MRFQRPFRAVRRRGSILIATLWVIIALTGLVITLSVRIRAAALAQANRAAAMQAAAAERGAEQFLLAVVDQKMQYRANNETDLTANISMQARTIGNCYVWIITPTYDDGQTANTEETYSYGLTDEQAKLDLNTASYSMLQWLPGMTQAMAASVVVWRGDADPTGTGAGDSYYGSLPDPYHTKKGPFESVGELALVKDFTSDVIYGLDTNHNGVLDPVEIQAAQAAGNAVNPAAGTDRGLFPFVTVLPISAGHVGNSGNNPATEIANINNETQLRTVLTNVLGTSPANQIMGRVQTHFANVFAFYFASGMTPEQFTKVYPRLTANSQEQTVNIMTAPPQVLACLPGLQNNSSLVSTILTQRQAQLQSTTDPTNAAWLVTLPQLRTALMNTLGDFITGASTVYSGDIVAVTANGRAYRRCRIVIQAGDGSSTPSKIIYREDLTSDGWPLDPAIRTALRAGQPPPGASPAIQSVATISMVSSGGGQL